MRNFEDIKRSLIIRKLSNLFMKIIEIIFNYHKNAQITTI